MLNKFGLIGTLRLIISLFYTKLFFRKARLVRLPFDIRNRKYIKIGKGFTSGYGCRIEAYPLDKDKKNCVKFGENVQINDYVHITAMDKVTIGNNVLMASNIYISDCSHGYYDGEIGDSSPQKKPIDREYKISSVVIKDNVWLGEFVSVLPGVIIGEGTIVGANSVVTKDIPAFVIAVGSPAKPIKKYNFNKNIWEKIY